MTHQPPARVRFGALALGLSAFLLMLFPLIRPFFALDIFEPERTITAASPAFASMLWVGSHFLAMVGFVLLLGGLLALYAIHAGAETERRAFHGLAWGIAGIALVLPAVGVETYTMPIIGKAYLEGATGLASVIPLTYRGPMTVVLLLGLLFLAVGAFNFAIAIRRGGQLPTWAGFVFAVGLTLWVPLFPRLVRIVDGLVIGLGGIPLAWSLWRRADASSSRSTTHQSLHEKGAAMNDIGQSPETPTSGEVHPRRRFFKRAAIATAIAGLTAGIGFKAFAQGGGPWHGPHAGFWSASLDPATMDQRLDRMLKHLYVEIDATDAQKQQLAPIVKAAAADLLPLRTQMRDARRPAVTLPSQEHVDRAALEALRAQQVQLAEQGSKRITQALADVADVLTVDQKKQLAARLDRWHSRRG